MLVLTLLCASLVFAFHLAFVSSLIISAAENVAELAYSIHVSILDGLFDDYLNRTVIHVPTWVEHADESSREFFFTSRYRYLNRLSQLGILIDDPVNGHQILVLPPLDGNGVGNNVVSEALELARQAEDLFNAFENYESGIVAMVALYALSAPSTYPTGTAMDADVLESIKTCLWLISQTEWERGYVLRAQHLMDTLFALLRAEGVATVLPTPAPGAPRGRLAETSLETSTYILFRLRRILSVPRMPMESAAAIQHRESVMYPALRAWMKEFAGVEIPPAHLSMGAATVFYLSHQGINERGVQELIAQGYSQLCPGLQFLAPALPVPVAWGQLAPPLTPAAGAPREVRCLRVGYVAAWFYEQSVGKLLYETVKEMALLQYTPLASGPNIDYYVEIVVYFIDQRATLDEAGQVSRSQDRYIRAYERLFAPDDSGGSTIPVGTCVNKPPIADRFLRLVNTAGGTLDSRLVQQMQAVIGSHVLDVLIFGEVGMDFATYLLSFGRMAAVQAIWWGHPVTTGNGDAIDYFLSLDAELPDAAEEAYSEQMVRMNLTNTLLSPPPLYPDLSGTGTGIFTDIAAMLQANPAFPSASDPAVIDPASVKFCLVIGATYKLHPDFLRMVADLLLQTEGWVEPVVVVFITERGSVEFNEDVILQIRTSLVDALAAAGDRVASVERLLARVQFHGYDSYFALLASASLVLDTFPYGGCLTTHDALSHGVPIVTFPQRYVRGRFSVAMFQQMGLLEYVTADATAYMEVVLDVLRRTQVEKAAAKAAIVHAFHRNASRPGSGHIHQNDLVAQEWLGFLIKAWRYQYEV
jgi:hypothetical protein